MNGWRDFFLFQKSDRRIVVLLSVVLLCSVVFLIAYRWHREAIDAQLSDNERDSLQQPLTGQTATPHAFDPNTVTYDELVAMGVEGRKAHTLINYRTAGKVFRTPDDLLDTYHWTSADVERLRPYISIDAAFVAENKRVQMAKRPRSSAELTAVNHETDRGNFDARPQRVSDKFATHTLVDINTADTTLLKRIPGIGSYYARSIVQLRHHLGGFVSVAQVDEHIGNFPPQAMAWLKVEPTTLTRLSISTSGDSLFRHPQLRRYAKALRNYQRLYGPITTPEQLRRTNILTQEELEKVEPYLRW